MILVTDDARFLKKIKLPARIWVQRTLFGFKMRFFDIFWSFNLYFSLKLHAMMACDNAQHLVEVKPTKKNWTQIWAKRAKIGSEIRFFTIFSSLVY